MFHDEKKQHAGDFPGTDKHPDEAEHEAVLSRRQAMRWIGLEYEARRGRRTIVCSGGNVLTASSFGSG